MGVDWAELAQEGPGVGQELERGKELDLLGGRSPILSSRLAPKAQGPGLSRPSPSLVIHTHSLIHLFSKHFQNTSSVPDSCDNALVSE